MQEMDEVSFAVRQITLNNRRQVSTTSQTARKIQAAELQLARLQEQERQRLLQLQLQQHVQQIERQSIERIKIESAQKRSTELDKEITALLNQNCCTPEQTAKMAHYLRSQACTRFCGVSEEQGDQGWTQDQFLLTYLRFLHEVIWRINSEFPSLFTRRDLPRLKTEFDMAVSTYQSALKGKALEASHQTGQKQKLEHERKYAQELTNRICDLPVGSSLTQAIGYTDHTAHTGHAMYANFEKKRDAQGGCYVRVKIYNLGAGLDRHLPSSQRQNNVYPLVVDLDRGQDIFNFSLALAEAHNLPAKAALDLIYRFQPRDMRKCIAELERRGDVLYEMQQTMGNCTAKNYLFSVRDRLNDDDFYRNLVISLAVLANNSYYVRQGRFPSPQELMGSTAVNSLIASETAFSQWTAKEIRQRIAEINLQFVHLLNREPVAAVEPLNQNFGHEVCFATEHLNRQPIETVEALNPNLGGDEVCFAEHYRAPILSAYHSSTPNTRAASEHQHSQPSFRPLHYRLPTR